MMEIMLRTLSFFLMFLLPFSSPLNETLVDHLLAIAPWMVSG